MSPRLFCRKCARVYRWAVSEENETKRLERIARRAREDHVTLLQLAA